MKTIILLIAILSAIFAHAQDLLKLKNTEAFNCKITFEDPEYIQFIRKGDTTMSIKKVPRYLVEYMQYNNSPEEAKNNLEADTNKVVPTIEQQNSIAKSNSGMSVSTEDYNRVANGFTAAIILGVGSATCGVVYLMSSVPQAPAQPDWLNPNSVDEYNRKLSAYSKDVNEYNQNIRILTGAGIGLAGVAVIVAASSGYQLAKLSRSSSAKLSFVPTFNGFNLAYRF
ncbi:MAG: hypothetical protein ACK4Y6_05600 [Bacteroidota bacterium]|jgi:hypothetical protein